VAGFITEEIRKSGERTGFHILTIPEGKKGILAQKGIPSPFRVGPYGVNIPVLENLGCESLHRAESAANVIIVDEIGKMELHSKKFSAVLTDVLNSPQKVLATIMERPHPFADKVKKRPDVHIVTLTRKNFEQVHEEVLSWLDN
jgi:nucleoside-triphosphatase